MNNSDNLIFVTRLSAKKLKELSGKLDEAAPRRIQGILNAIDRESAILSASVSKLSAYIDELKASEAVDAPVVPVPDDPNLLKIVDKIRSYENICAVCGGMRDDHTVTPDAGGATHGSYIRAHDRESKNE